HNVLYVSNANADLRYGGGTVQAVDLARFDRAVSDFHAKAANADTGLCVTDALDPLVVDCDETPFIFGAQTVKVGNFAGSIRILANPATPEQVRLFVGVRGDPSVTWIDVDYAGGGNATGTGIAAPSMSCYDNAAGSRALPHQPPACDASHLIQNFFDPTIACNNPTGGQPPPPDCPQGLTPLPTEPFGMVLDSGNEPTGEPYSRLVVSHLGGGQVSVIDTTGRPFIRSVSQPFFTADAGGHHGAFSLAPQHPGQALSLWYLTSDVQPTVQLFRIADAAVIVPAQSFSLSGAFGAGNDGRQIFFQADGNRAFLTENNPPSVVVVDTRPSPLSSTLPLNQVVDIVDVCQNPSHMLVRSVETAGAPGAPPLPQTRIYVVCFLSNQVMVVDPDRPEVLDTILLGRGPTEIAYYQRPVAPGAGVPSHRAYVSNFGEWTVSMIDLDPGSPTENRVIARIGLPVPPQVP
ncbi:MAG TPA: hypothetical protein VFF06_36925, partial [Polyangia bacterium]|nr:hypothetical protein [Polyangia bacterium]